MGWNFYRQFTSKDHRKFAQPFCCKCRADLREDWDDSMHCHECGASLEEPFAIYFGKKAKPYTRKRVIVGSILKILVFYVSFGFFYLFVFKMPAWNTDAFSNTTFIFPFVFFPIMMFFSTLITLRKGHGLPKVSHPYCSQCEYDLRVNWQQASHCPECGQDLSQSVSVYFGRSPARAGNQNFQKRSTAFALVMMIIILGMNLYNFLIQKTKPVPVVPAVPTGIPANSTPTPANPDTLQSEQPIKQTSNETP